MKFFAKLVALAAITALVGVLCACSALLKDNDATADAAQVLPGTWDLYEVMSDENALSPEDVDLLDKFGLYTRLEFYTNGDGMWTVAGTSVSFTWSGYSLTVSGATYDLVVEGDVLSMASEGDTLVYHRSQV